MHRVSFFNPADASEYVWPVNPDFAAANQYAQKQRQITRTSNTGNVGATKQQGDDGDYVIHWEPLVWHLAHEEALFAWYQICKTQSIYLTDMGGEQFEGQITTCGRKQIGALKGPGDMIAARGYYCQFVFEFDCYRFISGPMYSAGVTP